MLVYESTKENFMNDVENDTITDNIYSIYQEKIGKSPQAQIRSWHNSMEYMYKVLNNNEIPDDAGVAIEFTIPTTSKRVDFILSGLNEDKKESVIIIELKQWESAQSVIANGGGVSTDKSCIATQLFGISADEGNSELKFPTRTIVRDSYPDDETLKLWKENEDLVNGTELKYENTINRINSSANPRNIERVPRDSKFDFEIILSVYDEDNDENIISLLDSMKLIEDNYLGGSGSRGFGQIVFDDITISKRNTDYYIANNEEEIIVSDVSIMDAINQFKQ